jgi:hypothetical protein
MRKLLLTLALTGLVAVPVLAQPGPGGPGSDLLFNKSVQEELKLEAGIRKAIAYAQQKFKDAMAEAAPMFKDEPDKAMAMMRKATEETQAVLKKVRGKLSEKQTERLTQIEVQQANKNKSLEIFTNKSVVSALKLGDKGKDAITEVNKETRSLFAEAKGDNEKTREAIKKAAKLRTDAFDRIVKGFSDSQKEAWEKAQGEKFILVPDSKFISKDGFKDGFKDGSKDKKKEKSKK